MKETDDIIKIDVNGIKLAYTRTGAGKSVILLHGNGETHDIFDNLAPLLAKTCDLIMPDSRCHGKSENGELSYELMAQDIFQLMQALSLEKPDIIGFSDGGIVALLLAIRYPDSVGKIVACGANSKPKGLKACVRFLYRLSFALSHDKKIGLMLKEPHISAQQLGVIKVPVLLTVGEKDVVTQKDTAFLKLNISDSKLIVLEGCTHSDYIIHSEKLFKVAVDFLGLPQA